MKAQMFTDGGARGNPGPAAAGIVIKNIEKETISEVGIYLGETTNNVAEYKALLNGLKIAQEKGVKDLECFLDSELVVKQVTGLYKVNHEDLRVLKQRILEEVPHFERVTFSHIPRAKNQEADKLVNITLDAQN